MEMTALLIVRLLATCYLSGNLLTEDAIPGPGQGRKFLGGFLVPTRTDYLIASDNLEPRRLESRLRTLLRPPRRCTLNAFPARPIEGRPHPPRVESQRSRRQESCVWDQGGVARQVERVSALCGERPKRVN